MDCLHKLLELEQVSLVIHCHCWIAIHERYRVFVCAWINSWRWRCFHQVQLSEVGIHCSVHVLAKGWKGSVCVRDWICSCWVECYLQGIVPWRHHRSKHLRLRGVLLWYRWNHLLFFRGHFFGNDRIRSMILGRHILPFLELPQFLLIL